MNVLALAYVFPPNAGSGTYRTLYFANQWARGGDSITVLTVRQDDLEADALIDQELCRQVDPSITIVRARALRPLYWLLAWRARLRGAAAPSAAAEPRGSGGSPAQPPRVSLLQRLKDSFSGLLTFPDEHVGWVPDAVRRGWRVTRQRRIDCIYATGGPWSTLLAAALLQRLTGITLVIDFRDPWYSNPNLAARSARLRRAHRICERWCVAAARRVVLNTEELREDFIRRYSQLDAARFVCVPNGFETLPQFAMPRTDRFTVTHAGALYLSRNPANFLRAVQRLLERQEIPAQALRIRFVGGVDLRDPQIEAALRQLADVIEIIPRVPHAEALKLQQEAQVLLLFQSGFPLQIPRKVYEYLALAKPILAVTEAASATGRLVRELGAGRVTEDSAEAIAAALLALFHEWQSRTQAYIDADQLRRYSNEYLAARLRDAMRGGADQTTGVRAP
jgi:glycosyltransferase involved in cell wall biosynthesis